MIGTDSLICLSTTLSFYLFFSFLTMPPSFSSYSLFSVTPPSKVVDLAQGLLQTRATKARGLNSASLLLQPKNQVLLQVSHFIVRLREGVRYALSISDTTQSEKFAEAKAAWASVQTLLLEATKVVNLNLNLNLNEYQPIRATKTIAVRRSGGKSA